MEIIPILLGEREADCSTFLYLTNQGELRKINYYAWLIKSNEELTLVDVGFKEKPAVLRGLNVIKTIDEELKRHNVSPDDIKNVVLTHLHWDHASNLKVFRKAKFYVQQSEIDFVCSENMRYSCFNRFYELDLLKEELGWAEKDERLICLQGDYHLNDYISLMACGGHTPGLQIVSVKAPNGLAVICSDAVPLCQNWDEIIPPGIATDIIQAVRSILKISRLNAVTLYWGHDVVPIKQVGGVGDYKEIEE